MKTKDMCQGCRDNYYNQPGNSTSGECWMYASAVIVERTSVGTWEPPPYKWRPQKVLLCHHQDGLHWIKKNDPRIKDS